MEKPAIVTLNLNNMIIINKIMKIKTKIKVSLKHIDIIIHNTNIRRKMLKFKGRIVSECEQQNAGRVKMIYVLSEVDIIHCTFSVLNAVSLNTTAYLSFYTDFPTFFTLIKPVKH